MNEIKYWIEAIRLKTLPASICPIIIGNTIALSTGSFDIKIALYCLLFGIFCQIGANYSNDYLDFKKGADTPNRKGPRRLVSSGLIKPKSMKIASILTLSLAFLIGLNLVITGGLWIIIIGLLCITSAWAYTGGPYPLAYNALGDLFVILFFGIIAVNFTFYVQTLYFSYVALINGLGCGLLINNLLILNNLRDYDEDKLSNKRTSIVTFGKKFGVVLFLTSSLIALLIPIINCFIYKSIYPALGVAPTIISLIYAINLENIKDSLEYNLLLRNNGILVLVYGFCISYGIYLTF